MNAQKKKSPKISFREVVIASRPFWWINTAAPFFVGYLSVTKAPSLELILGTIYFLFPYNLAMYGINDIFDYESDIKNPRKTGINGSVLAKQKHPWLWLWIAVTNLPFIVYFFLTGSCAANVWLLVMLFMVVAYSIKWLRFKEIPLLDSVTSAFHYASPFMFGILYAGGLELWLPAFATFYIWVMANHAFGAIQDITPDREGGIDSVATVFGASRTILLCLTGYVVAAILPIVFYGRNGLFVSLLLLPYVYLVAQTLPSRQDDTAEIFKQNWKKFLYVNYAVGFVLSLYLIALTFYM